MTDTPVLTQELARQIEQVDIDYTRSRLGGMQAAEGNPLGIEIRVFGGATAFLIRAWPDFWYGNRVLGLSPPDVPYLADMVAFFRQHDLPFRLEIMPGNLDQELAGRLSDLGLHQVDFSAALYGGPRLPAERPGTGVSVRKIDMAELDLFLDLYEDALGQPRLNSRDKHIVAAWYEGDRPYLDFYVASLGDVPTGVGILYAQGGMGLLADAAVLPRFRGSGCHTALIRHRVERAIQKGCQLLTSFPAFGSTSHRNLERFGLRVAYTKVIWVTR
jgi:GNAT superfamily N-acetyltransferase